MLEVGGYEAPVMNKTVFENIRACIEVFYVSEGLFLIDLSSRLVIVKNFVFCALVLIT